MIPRAELKAVLLIVTVFLGFYFIPVDNPRIGAAVTEALLFVQDYAREHVLYGLLPAFFIAGAISAFISKAAVMKYMGGRASRVVEYAVASVSGTVLTICSCTVLPFFAGIYSRGAGLGPAITFLDAGPAINVLAILLTTRVLGVRLGVARAVGAIGFSILIGFIMHLIFRREESRRTEKALVAPEPEIDRPVGQVLALFALMIAVLAFVNWIEPGTSAGASAFVFAHKWVFTSIASVLLAALLVIWYSVKVWGPVLATAAVLVAAMVTGDPRLAFLVGVAGFIVIGASATRESREWMGSSWELAKEILPLLFVGILIAGAMLGRPGHEGLIPAEWVARLVGGNSPGSNLAASLAGGLMYFCTMTEIPIVQGLMGAGMGSGPALAFLLAGPAVSLPNVLVLKSIIGTRKAAAYLLLVVAFSSLIGFLYGSLFG